MAQLLSDAGLVLVQRSSADEPAANASDAVLGSGSFGTVYKARSSVEGKLYAVKVIDKRKVVEHYQLDDDRKILKEVRSLQGLEHPGVARYHGFFPADQATADFLCIKMDFYPGGTLDKALSPDTPTTVTRRRLTELAQAFAYLKGRGIIHRDFKADNVILDAGGHLRLVDFGLATPAAPSAGAGGLSTRALSTLHQQRGNPYYTSPEMRAGRDVGCTHDMFALGLVLAEMLLGATVEQLLDSEHFGYDPRKQKPFVKASGFSKLVADAATKDKGLAKVACDLLHADPAERMTPGGILDTLRDIQRGELGARLVSATPEVRASQAWVDAFRQKPTETLAAILKRLKKGSGSKRLVSKEEEGDARSEAVARSKNGPFPATLTEDEAAAVYLYTTDVLYKPINAGLRDPAKLASAEPFARLLDSAFSKLPSVPERTVFRGWTTEFDGQPGDVLRWRSFTSTSEAVGTAQEFARSGSGRSTLFYIRGKTGKDIRALSAKENEEEIMFRPGTPFRVDSVAFFGQGQAVVVLEELVD